jgi:hypothetical protein
MRICRLGARSTFGDFGPAAAGPKSPVRASASTRAGNYSGSMVASWNRLPSGSANTVRRIGGR